MEFGLLVKKNEDIILGRQIWFQSKQDVLTDQLRERPVVVEVECWNGRKLGLEKTTVICCFIDILIDGLDM